MTQNLFITLIITISFMINLLLIPILIYLSHKHELYDKIDERKIHTENTSRLGGIGIYSTFLITISVTFYFSHLFQFDVFKIEKNFLIIGASTLIIFAIGIIDDFTEVRAKYKLYGQIIAATVAILGGAVITEIDLPFSSLSFSLGYFSIPVTLIWIIGITNAVNLIDGLDGLSSGISIITSLVLGISFLIFDKFPSAIICFIIMGSLFGYLFYNFPPATIFMGDSGSLFLGFIFAVLPIATFPDSGKSMILPVTLLSIPIFDVFAAIWRRIRDKKAIFSPDRYHIHHKLLNLGLSARTILAIIYSFCIMLGIFSIIYQLNSVVGVYYIYSAWVLIGIFFLILHYTKK